MPISSRHDGHETRNGYNDTELQPMFDSFQEMMHFMHQQFPPRAEPKEIKHVVLDADDTIWQIDPWGLATLATPIGRSEGNTLPVRLNTAELQNVPEYYQQMAPVGQVKLDPKFRFTLKKLKERHIPVSIASNNDKQAVENYLEAFGVRGDIADVEASFFTPKDEMVEEIAKRQKVDSKNILFVDDSFYNCEDVHRHTQATPLLLGYHIDELDQLLEFIK
jgi:phosphoglycolate phosphatase-like HAD superfamily hydrolase